MISKGRLAKDMVVRLHLAPLIGSQGTVWVTDLNPAILSTVEITETKLCPIETGPLGDTFKIKNGSFNQVDSMLEVGSSAKEEKLRFNRFRGVRKD